MSASHIEDESSSSATALSSYLVTSLELLSHVLRINSLASVFSSDRTRVQGVLVTLLKTINSLTASQPDSSKLPQGKELLLPSAYDNLPEVRLV